MKMDYKNNTNKYNLTIVFVITFLSLVLSIITSAYRLKADYTANSGGLELVGNQDVGNTYELMENDVEYDEATGQYIVMGEDPYILFSNINAKQKGVFVNLSKEALSDIEIKIYWTKEGDTALSEKLSRSSVILSGQKTAYLKLPGYPINMFRIDISDDCVIDSLKLTDSSVRRNYTFGADFVIAVIIRMIIIFVVLCLAYRSYCESRVPSIDAGKNPDKAHKYEYDYIRTVAAVLVIMMHSICDIYVPQVSKGDAGYGVLKFVLGLSLSCNALYVMLSGALILRPKEEKLKDFYLHRMTKVLIPTLCYFGLYMFLGYREEIFANGVGAGLFDMLKSILSGRPAYMPHIWLVYTILGLYILAPFIRIIISKITDAQLFGLLLTGFIINVLVTYLPLCGMSFGIDTPIAAWLGIFMLGYYMTTEHAKRFYNLFIILGILGIAASILMIYHNPDLLAYTANWTPNMWLVSSGIFAFFIKFNKFFGRKNFIIEALSKYNFSIMLIHILILMKIVLPVGWRIEYVYGHLKLCIIGIILVSLIMSYVCSVIYDNTAVAAAYYVYGKISKKSDKN